LVLAGERPQRRELLRLGAGGAARDDERLVQRDRLAPVARLRSALRGGDEEPGQLGARLLGGDGVIQRVRAALGVAAAVGGRCAVRSSTGERHSNQRDNDCRTSSYPHVTIVARPTTVTVAWPTGWNALGVRASRRAAGWYSDPGPFGLVECK